MDHPCEPGGLEEMVLQDPFDYPAEDRLIEAWEKAIATLPEIRFENQPGFGLAYSGPGGRTPSKPFE